MKRSIILVFIGLALLALAACSNQPEKVAKEFFNAMEKRDFAAAKKLCTEDGVQLIEILESFANRMSEEQLKEELNTRYKVLSSTIEGNKAIVKYEEWDAQSPDEVSSRELALLKVDGKWKVDLSKDSISK